jgi:TolA-binding protein
MRFVAAAAVAMFAVGSFAAVWSGALPRLVEKLMTPQPAAEPIAPKRVAAPRAQVELAPQPEPELPAQVVVPQPVPAALPVPHVVKHAVQAPVPHEHAFDAAQLFATGNAARIRGDRAEAALRYDALLRQFPSSDEARLTHATLGRMLLDSGDAKGALGDGTLREEAMFARARSLALLDRTGEEAAAWQALLQQYPDSVHAERASARLRELGAR